MNSWYDHMSHTSEEESSDLLENINQLLSDYSHNQKNNQATKKILENIIDLCEHYIVSIPKELRTTLDSDKEKQLLKWPHLMRVLEIQKKAVSLLLLPQAENEAQARWEVLSNIFGLSETSASGKHGKRLENEYWTEARYQGNIAAYQWATNSSAELARMARLWSYQELLEENQNRSVIDKEYVNYFDNPDAHLTQFKDGKVYSKQGELLDTSKARILGEFGGECIYVLGMNGELYVSDPDEQKLPEFRHSSFFRGKPVMCAGTIIVEKGIIKEITLLSGHYKPRPKELLNFLELLQNAHNVDLQKISVIDKPNGGRRNALTYLKTRGFCLPEDRKDILRGQIRDILHDATVARERKNWKKSEELLERAISLGSDVALYKKADYILNTKHMYSDLPELERINQAIDILEKLSNVKPINRMAMNAQRLLSDYKLREELERELEEPEPEKTKEEKMDLPPAAPTQPKNKSVLRAPVALPQGKQTMTKRFLGLFSSVVSSTHQFSADDNGKKNNKPPNKMK